VKEVHPLPVNPENNTVSMISITPMALAMSTLNPDGLIFGSFTPQITPAKALLEDPHARYLRATR
jgi:hypothetical protein